MAAQHLARDIIRLVRQTHGHLKPPTPPNRQLGRTETKMIEQMVHGHRPDKPTVLGQANGEPAIQVYATGVYGPLRAKSVRWVTGTGVAAGLASGSLVEIADVSDTERQAIEAHTEAVAREAAHHMPNPAGAAFVEPDEAPIPEATDIDRALADLSKSALMDIAREVDLSGRSAMDKDELYEHLRVMPGIGDYV